MEKELKSTYVITQDTRAIFERINKGELSDDFLVAVERYFDAVQDIILFGYNNTIDVAAYKERDIAKRLTTAVKEELHKDPDVYCICLDRFLLTDIEIQYPERFFRFSVTRTADGIKVPRSGDSPFAEQIKNLTQTIPNINRKQAILVDDGIFSGGTFQDVLRMFQLSRVPVNIKSVIGFIGSKEKQNGAIILEPIENLYEWVDIRDFSPLGGKTIATSRNNFVASAAPYLYPWTFGEGASFDTSPYMFAISRAMILEFQKLVVSFEQSVCNTLRFRDLAKSGFTFPTSTVIKDGLPVFLNDRVSDYLDHCLQKIDEEQKRLVYIIDMDGTLYQLDGERGGYTGSKLEKNVFENAINFIKIREDCSTDEASAIYASGVAEPVGLSNYLSERYGISRSDYFDSVWDIDPTAIVQQYEIPVQTIRELKQTNIKLILVTSAPRVWMKRVLETLGIQDAFELIFTGEQFGTKNEIFKRLAGWYVPSNVVSIGDQEKTDITPAKAYGFRTLLVTSPAEVSNILNVV